MKWKSPITMTLSEPSIFPAFAPIVSDAFEHLRCLPDGVTIGNGELVLEQDLHPSSVYLLREGLVKLVYVSHEGRETVLGLRASGWYAGAVSALMHTPSIYSVRTVTPCIVSTITSQDFSMKLMQSSRMMRHFMDTLCNEIISLSVEAQVKAGPAEQRLAQYLFERNTTNPQIKTLDTLPLLKQMELAQLLAITPEHLSRLLHKTDAAQDTEHIEKSVKYIQD